MKRLMVRMVITGALMSVAAGAMATELVYTPINPSFGGSPLNGSFLLSQASAQNSYTNSSRLAGSVASGSSADPVQQFQDQLNRMMLSNLADKLIGQAFGTNAVASGTYTMGTLKINVDGTTDPTNLQVTVTNIATGSVTTITLPVYQ